MAFRALTHADDAVAVRVSDGGHATVAEETETDLPHFAVVAIIGPGQDRTVEDFGGFLEADSVLAPVLGVLGVVPFEARYGRHSRIYKCHYGDDMSSLAVQSASGLDRPAYCVLDNAPPRGRFEGVDVASEETAFARLLGMRKGGWTPRPTSP